MSNGDDVGVAAWIYAVVVVAVGLLLLAVFAVAAVCIFRFYRGRRIAPPASSQSTPAPTSQTVTNLRKFKCGFFLFWFCFCFWFLVFSFFFFYSFDAIATAATNSNTYGHINAVTIGMQSCRIDNGTFACLLFCC